MLVSLDYPATGIHSVNSPVFFDQSGAGRFIDTTVNLRIHEGRWRTRYAVREIEITGDEAAVSAWRAAHTQAAIWYAPRSGQGAHYLGVGVGRIIESAAGALYCLTPDGHGMRVTDISNGMVAKTSLRLAWLCQGENYVIRTDGVSPTQIYNGKEVVGSPGYSALAKTAARFPNKAGPTVYAGGRFYTTLFGRRIYVSDSLHQLNQSDASDLLKFTDQTYDYINVFFAPPADSGDILALTTTVNAGFDNSRAQGEVLAFCDGPSAWGVALGIPRTEWPTAKMRFQRSVETGATGPNAFFVRDGDIIMRTSRGIETMNLLARERAAIGNPVIDLGADIRRHLHRDAEDALIFASMVNPSRWDRLYCTIGPVISGPRHWHMGWVTANWNPTLERSPNSFAWEGINTVPADIGRVVQFLSFREDGTSRVLALLDKRDGQSKGLAEITQLEMHDETADGTPKPIQWSILTRRLSSGGLFQTSTPAEMLGWLGDMRTEVNLKISYRTNRQREWKIHTVKRFQLVGESGDVACGNGDRSIHLGKPLPDARGVQWVQFLIEGTGVCSPSFALNITNAAGLSNEGEGDCINVESDEGCPINPFAYAL